MNCLLAEQRDYLGGTSSHTEMTSRGRKGQFFRDAAHRAHRLRAGDCRRAVFADGSYRRGSTTTGNYILAKGWRQGWGQLELVFGPNGVLKFGSGTYWRGRKKRAYRCVLGHPLTRAEETIREWVTRTLGEGVGWGASTLREWCLCWRSARCPCPRHYPKSTE